MIKITLIFGEGAVRKYDESKELPSQEWLLDNGGVVDEKAFRTEAEYNAYVAGVNDADGWTDYRIIRHKDEPEDTDTSHEEAVWLRLGLPSKAAVRRSKKSWKAIRILFGNCLKLDVMK